MSRTAWRQTTTDEIRVGDLIDTRKGTRRISSISTASDVVTIWYQRSRTVQAVAAEVSIGSALRIGHII